MKKRWLPILLGFLTAVLHAWALAMLWMNGPANRRGILVGVYALLLVGSALLTRRFPPPFLASLIPFGVVLVWRAKDLFGG